LVSKVVATVPPVAINNSSANIVLEKVSDLLQKQVSKQKASSHVPMEHIVSVKNTVVVVSAAAEATDAKDRLFCGEFIAR
jgi:hypothetical protein